MSVPKLPPTVRYAEPAYWDSRYEREPALFDWFFGHTALRRIIRAYLSKKKPILQIGCGTSNLQEGMAQSGYSIVNTDISTVVISQMQERHATYTNMSYVVSDCRCMPEFRDCQFGHVLDKGTMDALLCCKQGTENVMRMLLEIYRVLQPGGSFLLITLGDPTKRLPLLLDPRLQWKVSLLLLPKISAACQAYVDGKPINDTIQPIDADGPYEVLDQDTIVGLPPGVQYSNFFFAYVCKKQPLQLPLAQGQRAQLPNGWVTGSKELFQKLQKELGLPEDLLAKGRRKRVVHVPAGSAASMHGLPMAAHASSSAAMAAAAAAQSIAHKEQQLQQLQQEQHFHQQQHDQEQERILQQAAVAKLQELLGGSQQEQQLQEQLPAAVGGLNIQDVPARPQSAPNLANMVDEEDPADIAGPAAFAQQGLQHGLPRGGSVQVAAPLSGRLSEGLGTPEAAALQPASDTGAPAAVAVAPAGTAAAPAPAAAAAGPGSQPGAADAVVAPGVGAHAVDHSSEVHGAGDGPFPPVSTEVQQCEVEAPAGPPLDSQGIMRTNIAAAAGFKAQPPPRWAMLQPSSAAESAALATAAVAAVPLEPRAPRAGGLGRVPRLRRFSTESTAYPLSALAMLRHQQSQHSERAADGLVMHDVAASEACGGAAAAAAVAAAVWGHTRPSKSRRLSGVSVMSSLSMVSSECITNDEEEDSETTEDFASLCTMAGEVQGEQWQQQGQQMVAGSGSGSACSKQAILSRLMGPGVGSSSSTAEAEGLEEEPAVQQDEQQQDQACGMEAGLELVPELPEECEQQPESPQLEQLLLSVQTRAEQPGQQQDGLGVVGVEGGAQSSRSKDSCSSGLGMMHCQCADV